MQFYKNIFKNRISVSVAGSKGAKPSFLMPPDGSFTKIGFQLYEALDLISEGPITGLTDQKGKLLTSLRSKKEFSNANNEIGSSSEGVDKGVYFDNIPLRDERDSPNLGKYDVSLRVGEEFQDPPLVGSTPERIKNFKRPIKGPYSMSGAENGARTGSGSRDVRREGTSARDFVNWQNFVPRERNPEPFLYTNYDKNIKKITLNMQIDQLMDTKSFSSASENEAGRSKIGTHLPATITFEIKVGKLNSDGSSTEQFAVFTTRAGKSVSVGNGNGRVSITGVITSPYSISLENIQIPDLEENDLYNFVEIQKIEHETISNLVKRDGGINSIVESGDENFIYPNSATVSTSIDSRYYPSVPERTFRVKGKKVLIPSNYHPVNNCSIDRRFSKDGNSSGRIIYGDLNFDGGCDDLDGTELSNNRDWDGSFKLGWTDNPAWIYFDLLVNSRYGIGSYLRDVNIVDKWSLYEIGRYCDAVNANGEFVGLDDGFGGLEPRFSCNISIKDQKNAIEILQDLSKTFRAMTYYNNASVGVRVDRPYFFEDFDRSDLFEESLTKTLPESNEFVPPKNLKFPPHLMFNNLNVKDGQFVYADTDNTQKLSAIEISYLDKRSNFTAKTEYVEDEEAIKKVGINLKQVAGLGITSRGQANRLAKYLLFESANTTETVSFNVGFEGLLLQPGDIVQVDDEMRNFSKNFGTVLTTSGQEYYFNPDSTGQGLTNIESGLGPKSIIVEPSINSDQLELIAKGNIHIYNGIGRSGIDEFYKNPTSDNKLYQKIHNPQTISLKIVEGGSGFSYDILEEGVAIHIDSVGTFAGTNYATDTNAFTQWFSENPANIIAGSEYSIDISGRNPKYYRVINIEENPDFGYGVLGLIHHTGKFKLIEENVSFDLDADSFQPDLTITDFTKPAAPIQVTTGAFSSNLDGSLNLPLEITPSAAIPGQKFIVFLEEPNTNQIISQVDKDSGATTTITLSGQSKIDQIGDYEINIFSENTTPVVARSNNAFTINFTTQASDFGLNVSTDSFVEYKDISILTDFINGEYDNVNETGSANVSFIENDPNINATFNLEFEDIFGNSDNNVLQSISSQVINLLDRQGNLKKSSFKTLTNETSFTVSNEDLDEGFGYTGDARYFIPSGLKFQANFFTLSGSGDLSTSGQFIEFEAETDFYEEPPIVFIQQIKQGSFEDSDGREIKQKQIGRVSSTTSGFFVTGLMPNETNYAYFASPTGVFKFANNSKTIEVKQFNKGQNSAYIDLEFENSFSSSPKVITQLQQADHPTESLFCSTNITGSSVSGFSVNAFDENGNAFAANSVFGYIATDEESFNILLNNSLPLNSINIASSGASGFNTIEDNILEEFNGTGYRYNFDNQMIFSQKTTSGYQEEFSVIHRTGNQNKVINYLMDINDYQSGIKFKNSDGSTNNISLSGSSFAYEDDISLVTWARFSEDLTGKQYLMEYSNGNTGIAWFQSGDGKNYVNINGEDFEAISTPINDNQPHMIQVVIDRDLELVGYLDGSLNYSNSSITGTDFTGDLYPSRNNINLLGNSSLTGTSLTQGLALNYMAFITGDLVTGDYYSNPYSFFTGYNSHPNTNFMVSFSGNNYPVFTDESSNYSSVQVNGEIQKSDQIINRFSLHNFDFIQIGNTGTL